MTFEIKSLSPATVSDFAALVEQARANLPGLACCSGWALGRLNEARGASVFKTP